ncbi:MAG: ATP-dependent chaperone protein ClpB, partial [Pseudomonadota bacterium]
MNFEKLTVRAKEAFRDARSLARRGEHQQLEPEHLLKALVDQKDGIALPLLERIGADAKLLRARIDESLGRLPRVKGAGGEHASPRLTRTLDAAEDEAKRLRDEYVSSEHLLLVLADDKQGAGEALRSTGATRDRLRTVVTELRGGERITSEDAEARFEALEKYARDLTASARAGKLDPVIGRDEEIRRVMQVLSRRTKNNPVLIGDPGVGKTAIVEGLARRIVDGDVPEPLKNRKLVALDM